MAVLSQKVRNDLQSFPDHLGPVTTDLLNTAQIITPHDATSGEFWAFRTYGWLKASFQVTNTGTDGAPNFKFYKSNDGTIGSGVEFATLNISIGGDTDFIEICNLTSEFLYVEYNPGGATTGTIDQIELNLNGR